MLIDEHRRLGPFGKPKQGLRPFRAIPMSNPTDIANQATRRLTDWMLSSPDWTGEFDTVLEEHLGPVCEVLEIDKAQLFEELGEASFHVFGCAAEDLMGRQYEEAPYNLVDDYLKRRGWKENPIGKRYLEAIRDSVPSLYEVVNVVPGAWVEIKDLLREGPPVRVSEKSGSKTLVKWDRLAARVVKPLDQSVFTGTLLLLQEETADRLLNVVRETLQKAAEKLAQDGQPAWSAEAYRELVDWMLRQSAPIITTAWLTGTLAKLRAPLPRLVNFDGEPIELCEARFPVEPEARREIAARLDALPELERTGGKPPSWSWIGQKKAAPRQAEASGEERVLTLDSHPEGDDSRLSLGSIELKGATLVFFANSSARAERGKAMLEAALQGLVGQCEITRRSPEAALEEGKDRPKPKKSLPPEQEAQVLREYKDRHYRAWMDEKIPALDHLTPREASQTPDGREKLIALLKHIENHEARAQRNGAPGYDIAWLWRELGLSP